MQVTAHLNKLRIAPRKVRLAANLVKGLPLAEAIAVLEFSAKRSARPLQKLIMAAAADAEHNFKLKKEDLIIKQMFVNSDVTMKRYTPRAFGRAAMIRKRGSQVTVTLISQTGAKVQRTAAAGAAEQRSEQKKEALTTAAPATGKKDIRASVKPKSPFSLKSRLFSRKTG